MSTTTALTVPTGPYWGFTLKELEAERDRLISDRKALSVRLQGSSVNGQSFQFAGIEAQRIELAVRGNDLQAAFWYLDPGLYPLQPPTDTAVATFLGS